MRLISRRHNTKRRLSLPADRMLIANLMIWVMGAFVFVRLFHLQVLQNPQYLAQAQLAQEFSTQLPATRGEVFARTTGQGSVGTIVPLILNKDQWELYAVPKWVTQPEHISLELTNIISGSDQKDLQERLSRKNDPYVTLANGLTFDQKKSIEALNVEGLGFSPQNVRFYPQKSATAHITGFYGFVNKDRIGRYGIEEYFNDVLHGTPGALAGERDVAGRMISTGTRNIVPPVNGATIITTIDPTIQFTACDALQKAVLKHGADGGSVIIMEPSTGHIIALCNAPTFDPNDYKHVENVKTFVNGTISHNYEPGSVFKVITMASGIEKGVVSPSSTYEDKGFVTFGPNTIRNAAEKVYGVQTMTGVLENSINTGAVYVAQKVGGLDMKKYIQEFGFGKRTGVELSGESLGDIRSLDNRGNDIYIATASFGQGISVTPIQMISAINVIANNGVYVAPSMIDSLRYANGQVVSSVSDKHRVVSEKTATLVAAMMVSVVNNGHAKRAGIKGYTIGGKTGTAQVAEPGKRGYSNRYIHTFVGFGPIDNPRFTILTKIDDPKDVQYAEGSAVPLAGEIEQFLLHYWSVPPSS